MTEGEEEQFNEVEIKREVEEESEDFEDMSDDSDDMDSQVQEQVDTKAKKKPKKMSVKQRQSELKKNHQRKFFQGL